MFARFCKKMRLGEVPRDLVLMAFVNGLSGMALNGAAIFGMLAILSGKTFLHGVSGLAAYVSISALSILVGYAGVCRYAARFNLRTVSVLYAVFVIYALGFVGAAVVHPIVIAPASGLGLGMFYSAFMLRSIDSIEDHARDGYATLNGLIQQVATLLTPFLGAGMLYLSSLLGLHNLFGPTFLSFGVCVLLAFPLIRGMTSEALPYNVALPMKAVMERQHLGAIGLFLTSNFCETLMNPLLLLSSFALLGKVVNVGWFSGLIAIMACFSLALSHRIRLPGQRWLIVGGSLIGVGLGFLAFDLSFSFGVLVFAGAAFALFRANYSAAWFSFSTRVIEREWGHFGKNQALVMAEIFTFLARIVCAVFLLILGNLDLTFRQCLPPITALYLMSAVVCLIITRSLDDKTVVKQSSLS